MHAVAHLPTNSAKAAPVVAELQAARAALDAAGTPEAVEDVRGRLRVLREVCAAALRDPNVSPEDVAATKRECEQLALEAAVKLGTMVPEEGAPGARTDLGSTSATVAEVAKRCGLSRDTLTRYRALAVAFRTKATDFMSIAREAINAGREVPLGRLIELVKPPAPKPEPAPPAGPRRQPRTVDEARDAPSPAPPARGTTDPKAMASLAVPEAEGDPEKKPSPKRGADEPPQRLVSLAADCERHALALEALVRFLGVADVEVGTPSLYRALDAAKGFARPPILPELVRILRQIAEEDRQVVETEQRRIDDLHAKAKAERRAAMRGTR